MPVSYEKDENGRLIRKGNYDPVTPAPAAGKGKPAAGNPFANVLGNFRKKVDAVQNALEYEGKRFSQDPLKRITEIAKPVARKVTNDIRYELKPEVRRDTGRAVRNAVKLATNPLTPVAEKLKPYTTSATADVVRNGIEAYQKTLGGRKKGDYALNPLGRAVDTWEDRAYTERGFKPRQEQEGLERLGTELATGVVGGVAAVATGGLALKGAGAALQGVPLAGRAIAGMSNLLNPTVATTARGALGRVALAGAMEEVATTPFVDNTGASSVSLMNLLLGTEFKDPVQPEMDRIEAAQAALLPNAAAGALIPAALAALPLKGMFHGIGRARQVEAEVAPIKQARTTLEAERVLEKDPETGATRFTDEVVNQPKPEAPAPPPATFAEARERILQKAEGGQEAVPAPKAEEPTPAPEAAPAPKTEEVPAPDPEASAFDTRDYDPATTFEADVVLKELRELSYEDVLGLYQLDPSQPVTLGIEEIGAARTPRRYESNVNWSEVSAPKNAVSEDWVNGKYQSRLEAQDVEDLRGLFRNSPELQSMALAQVGKPVEGLTKADMVRVLQAHPDRVLLPSRLNNPFESAWDIAVKPDEYQFKQSVNEAGVQVGNSLQGVERWDPDAEGTLEVRRLPEDGSLDMVNGHNRLDLAKRLGIPSVPTKYFRTNTAAEAREMGAISNISSGGGTVWDAAKFLKENPGLDSMAKLKASGKPGKSGFWRDGLALAQLPPDLFKAAQDGVIDTRYAVLIGNSRLPEEKMRTLFRKAASSPSMDNMTAYIEIARHAGGGDVIQGGLLGGEVEDLSDQLAELYASLMRVIAEDKSLFGRVSKEAKKLRERTATQVDVKGAISISEEAKAAQRFVKGNWVTDPTLNKLMNDGARAIKNGESVASVINSIKQEIPGILEDAMGRKAAPTLELEGGEKAPDAGGPGPDTETGAEAPTPEQAGTPLFDIPGEAEGGSIPDPAPAGAVTFKASPEQVAKWEKWTPERQDETAAWANKQLLTERQLKNRQKKAADVTAREERAFEWMDDDLMRQLTELDPAAREERIKAIQSNPEGRDFEFRPVTEEEYRAKWGDPNSGEPPAVMPANAEYKVMKELEAHSRALDYLDWYDNRVAKRAPEPGEKAAMELELIRRGIANGELRPPDLEIPEIVAAEGVDLEKAAQELMAGQPGEALAHAVDEEARLRAIHAEQDQAVKGAMVEAQREADGYYEEPYEARIPEVLNEVEPVESVSIADSLQALHEALIESDRRLYRGVGEFMDRTQELVDELADEAPAAAPPTQLAAEVWTKALVRAKELEIPEEAMRPTSTVALQKAMGQTLWEWGIARTPGEGKAMAGKAGVFIQATKLGGFDRSDFNLFRNYSNPMNSENLKIQEKLRLFYNPGRGLAPTGKPGHIRIRPDDLHTDIRASSRSDLRSLPPGHPDRVEAIKAMVREQMVDEEEGALSAWAEVIGIQKQVKRLVNQYGRDIQDAVAEGIRISGIDPERFRVVREINLLDNFGVEDVARAQDAWDPYSGELIRADPASAEARWVAGGRTGGLQAGRAPNLQLADTVQVALNLNLDLTMTQFAERAAARKKGVKVPRTIGSVVHRTAYHEAFHRLQKVALTSDELSTLRQNHDRMKDIIQQGGGEWSDTMDLPEGQWEIQAEAFGTWASNRRARETGHVVDRIFQKLSDFLAPVRRKLRQLRGIEPDPVTDLFELVYSGDIGKRSPSELNQLSRAIDPDLMTLMPKLRQNLEEQFRARLADTRAYLQKLQDDLNNGGCT